MIMIVDLFLRSFHPIGKDWRIDLFIILKCFSSHLLQADSQIESEQWIHSLQLTITNLFKSPDSELTNSSSVNILIETNFSIIFFHF